MGNRADFNTVFRPLKKATFELRPKEQECGQSSEEQSSGKCKDPEVGTNLVFLETEKDQCGWNVLLTNLQLQTHKCWMNCDIYIYISEIQLN